LQVECSQVVDVYFFIVVECKELPSLLNGDVHAPSRTYKSRVKFTCNSGHDLVGSLYAVCEANGRWSEDMPSCVAISISELNVAKLSPENYTSEIAETVVRQLDNLTSSQNLTSTNVTSTVDVLESLVTLQEKVLEEGGSLNLSNEFVNVRIRQIYISS
jgi:hypothetical protein